MAFPLAPMATKISVDTTALARKKFRLMQCPWLNSLQVFFVFLRPLLKDSTGAALDCLILATALDTMSEIFKLSLSVWTESNNDYEDFKFQ